MVSEVAKLILRDVPKADPLKVAHFTGDSEQACWEYLEELQQSLNEQVGLRDETAIRTDAREWASMLPEAFETKRLILLERLRSATSEQEKKERLIHYKLFTNKLDSLPPDRIERARNYPIQDLLGTNKRITNCPFHDDRTASLNIKNNFYYCHGCGVSGDAIDFVMRKYGLSFREAVLKLT